MVKKIDFKDEAPEKNCYEKIKKHIITNNSSVPYKKVSYCVVFDNNPFTDFVTYTGTSLDILSGLIYLKEFDNTFTTLTKKFIVNEEESIASLRQQQQQHACMSIVSRSC